MVDVKAEKKALTELIDVTFKAEDKKDLKTLLEFFADDVICHGPGMPQFQGIKALKEFYEGYLKTLVTIKGESTHIEVSSSGDMAWDVGFNKAEFKDPKGNFKDQGKYFASYKKVNGKWKCAAIAFSGDNPAQ
jgi:ketosteroid isomerase-like protein